MKKIWKIGVNSHAMKPSGLSGAAGASGIAAGFSVGVGVGAGVAPGAGVGAGKQATRTSRTTTPRRTGPSHVGSAMRRVTVGGVKDRVVAARVARVAPPMRFMPIQLPLSRP